MSVLAYVVDVDVDIDIDIDCGVGVGDVVKEASRSHRRAAEK